MRGSNFPSDIIYFMLRSFEDSPIEYSMTKMQPSQSNKSWKPLVLLAIVLLAFFFFIYLMTGNGKEKTKPKATVTGSSHPERASAIPQVHWQNACAKGDLLADDNRFIYENKRFYPDFYDRIPDSSYL